MVAPECLWSPLRCLILTNLLPSGFSHPSFNASSFAQSFAWCFLFIPAPSYSSLSAPELTTHCFPLFFLPAHFCDVFINHSSKICVFNYDFHPQCHINICTIFSQSQFQIEILDFFSKLDPFLTPLSCAASSIFLLVTQKEGHFWISFLRIRPPSCSTPSHLKSLQILSTFLCVVYLIFPFCSHCLH